jgi:hypothetical protein
MKRLVAALTIAGAAGLGGVLAAGPASAASVCAHVDITVNGENQVQDVCLPPEGTEPPALPGL